jgi:uncharacterized protein (DUF58 family)
MKIRWPVIVVLILTLGLALAGGMTMMWRLFIFLLVLLVVSYFWLRILSRQVQGRLDKATQFARVGDFFEETFTVSNKGRLPLLMCEAKEDTDIPDYLNNVKFSLPSWGTYTWHIRSKCRKRGQFRIAVLGTRIYDPLGFFSVTSELTDVKYLNVLPGLIELPNFQVLPRREPGLNTRRWFAGEPGLNASRVREYTSGDSLRHIHWHSTAHTGQLMVKEFDPDLTKTYYFNDVWIILDMHHDTDLGEDEENAAEYGITIATSLVKKYLDNEKKVGFMASGDHSFLFPPDNGVAHEQRINQALAMLKPAGEVHLESLITSQEERVEAGSAVIVITTADYGRLGNPLRRLLNRGSAITAILLDGVSFGGKTAAAETARALTAAHINVYTVRRGMDIARALDVRHISSGAQYTGAFGNK